MGIEVKPEPPIVISLKSEAMRNSSKGVAGSKTGKASRGNVTLAYYPACKRFVWFVDKDPCIKSYAIGLLMDAILKKRSA